MSLATVIAVTVPVTREHLSTGIPGNCRRCALALAVTDAIEGAVAARVFYDGADARAHAALADGGILILGLGPDVARTIARIDAHGDVAPFTFTAEVLDEFTEKELAA